MRTLEYATHEIVFSKSRQACGGAIIEAAVKDEDGFWEPYAMLTVDIGVTGSDSLAHLETNDNPNLVEWVIGKGWARIIGEGCSEFCTYPLAEFTDEFLDEICFDNGVV